MEGTYNKKFTLFYILLSSLIVLVPLSAYAKDAKDTDGGKRRLLEPEPTTKRVSIVGVIGEGPHYSDVISFPRKIGKTKLFTISSITDPNPACRYGVNLSDDKKECQVWCEFCGAIGKKARARFKLKVWYVYEKKGSGQAKRLKWLQ